MKSGGFFTSIILLTPLKCEIDMTEDIIENGNSRNYGYKTGRYQKSIAEFSKEKQRNFSACWYKTVAFSLHFPYNSREIICRSGRIDDEENKNIDCIYG